LVKESNLQRYLELSDLQTFIDQLNAQKDYMLKGSTSPEIQNELDQLLFRTLLMMKKDSTKKMHRFYEAYAELLDANLLKTALKQHIQKQHIDEDLSKQAKSEEISRQLRILSTAGPEDFTEALESLQFSDSIISLVKNKDDTFSYFALDAAVDKMMISKLLRIKMPYKCDEATQGYLKRMIDIRTIKHLLRAKHLSYDADHCKELLIDDGYELAFWKQEELCHAENLSDFVNKLEGTKYYQALKEVHDKKKKTDSSIQPYTDALDMLWLLLVKDISTAHYSTVGPSLRFIEYKQQEIRNLKIITKGISEKLSSSAISSLLIMEEST
jgi:vacuolar-type H+-ATPase subunit C/Vma6